ncbi:hypothetical protein MKEN_01024900 [Mycena kentingensis (nom. inval.)]|nr:hypothetical protein MKEN_01024900 [Mycena kentingensis (nom. inval.)]
MDAHHLPASEPHRVADLWYDDGTIVIQAGDAQYRVYRGTLARRSPIFQDLFSVPQPENETLVDGCPFVRLPDAEAEVTPFLKALFDSEFFPAYPAPTNLRDIYGCLRLSHKYEIPDLKRRALVHLSSPFRTCLSQVDSIMSCHVDHELWEENPSYSRVMNWEWTDTAGLMAVAQVAREVGALWVLPRVFYSLSKADMGRQLFLGTEYRGLTVSLSQIDQNAIKTATSLLMDTSLQMLSTMQGQFLESGCTTPADCLRARVERFLVFRPVESQDLRDPLVLWELMSVHTTYAPDSVRICGRCWPVLGRIQQDLRRMLWETLPDVYGLPNWDDLHRMRSEAIGDAFSDYLD